MGRGLFTPPRQLPQERPMIKDEFTDMLKKKMSFAVIPFVIGAIILVVALDKRVTDPTMKIGLMLVGLVLFVIGFGFFVRYARDLKNYSIMKWEELEAEKAGAKGPVDKQSAVNSEPVKPQEKQATNRPRSMADIAASVSKLEDAPEE